MIFFGTLPAVGCQVGQIPQQVGPSCYRLHNKVLPEKYIYMYVHPYIHIYVCMYIKLYLEEKTEDIEKTKIK